jgi:predicted AAA+ superfamily ATPase
VKLTDGHQNERIKGDRASFALIGGRRFGKTSLLMRLYEDRLPNAGFRTVYYDCAQLNASEKFFAVIVHDWQPAPPPATPVTFRDLLESPPRDRPLVFLLDEVDQLVPLDRENGWQLFNLLRARASSGYAQFVFSGERSLREVLRDSTTPFFNFAIEMPLEPLDFRDVEELVTRPMRQLEIEFANEAEVVRQIYTFTSGHPNVVQRLCSRLLERLDKQSTRRITPNDVEKVTSDPQFVREDFLLTYFSRASTLEHLCALLMAIDANVRTLSSVHDVLAKNGITATLNQVDAALERLVDLRRILARSPEGYQFAVEAFPLIVAKSKRVSDWVALRREIFVHVGDILPEKAPPELQGRLW